jgi:adenine/guanine phosphoribosyltransferase-like PRPP-binding protein
MSMSKNVVKEAFDRKPLTWIGNYRFLVNPLTEQIPATSSELLRETTKWLVAEGDFAAANKIAGEEDKGAILVAATSLATGLPFGMARWYPAGLEGQVAVDFRMEYTTGRLFLNGVEPGDKVIIVDDMISSGGTLLAMIKAIGLAKAEIVDIVCVAEKVDYGGAVRVLTETGYRVKTLVKVSVEGTVSRVLN